MEHKIFIVVPEYKPGRCGVSDHADIIKERLKPIGFCVAIGNADEFVSSISKDEVKCVLIEFVLYGYQIRGIPYNIMNVIDVAVRKGVKVLTFFHELPAPIFPLRRSSILRPLQRLVCSMIASKSDAVIVNQQRGLIWLKDKSRRTAVFLPTWSSVGEPDEVSGYRSRPNYVVVFGTPMRRTKVHSAVSNLGGYRHLFGDDVTVLDIGATCDIPEGIASEILRCGALSSVEVSNRLSVSRYGLFSCPITEVSKSSVFASYCAHGVIPVNVERGNSWSIIAGPRPDMHYLMLENVGSTTRSLSLIIENNIEWKRKYSISRSMSRISGILESICL